MSKHIVLDSTPLGLLSKSAGSTEVLPVVLWARACLTAGHGVYVPEVIDYELRRELVRAKKVRGLRELDELRRAFNFLPINSAAMLLAAELWAQSRNSGQPTGSPLKLNIDAILAAQALTLSAPSGDTAIVASDNVGHLSRFVTADLWTNIQP